MIGVHVGDSVDIPDYVLREATVRLAFYLKNTQPVAGLSRVEGSSPIGGAVQLTSEFHGGAVRRSGVMGLLSPWREKRAGVI